MRKNVKWMLLCLLLSVVVSINSFGQDNEVVVRSAYFSLRQVTGIPLSGLNGKHKDKDHNDLDANIGVGAAGNLFINFSEKWGVYIHFGSTRYRLDKQPIFDEFKNAHQDSINFDNGTAYINSGILQKPNIVYSRFIIGPSYYKKWKKHQFNFFSAIGVSWFTDEDLSVVFVDDSGPTNKHLYRNVIIGGKISPMMKIGGDFRLFANRRISLLGYLDYSISIVNHEREVEDVFTSSSYSWTVKSEDSFFQTIQLLNIGIGLSYNFR